MEMNLLATMFFSKKKNALVVADTIDALVYVQYIFTAVSTTGCKHVSELSTNKRFMSTHFNMPGEILDLRCVNFWYLSVARVIVEIIDRTANITQFIKEKYATIVTSYEIMNE